MGSAAIAGDAAPTDEAATARRAASRASATGVSLRMFVPLPDLLLTAAIFIIAPSLIIPPTCKTLLRGCVYCLSSFRRTGRDGQAEREEV